MFKRRSIEKRTILKVNRYRSTEKDNRQVSFTNDQWEGENRKTTSLKQEDIKIVLENEHA